MSVAAPERSVSTSSAENSGEKSTKARIAELGLSDAQSTAFESQINDLKLLTSKETGQYSDQSQDLSDTLNMLAITAQGEEIHDDRFVSVNEALTHEQKQELGKIIDQELGEDNLKWLIENTNQSDFGTKEIEALDEIFNLNNVNTANFGVMFNKAGEVLPSRTSEPETAESNEAKSTERKGHEEHVAVLQEAGLKGGSANMISGALEELFRADGDPAKQTDKFNNLKLAIKFAEKWGGDEGVDYKEIKNLVTTMMSAELGLQRTKELKKEYKDARKAEKAVEAAIAETIEAERIKGEEQKAISQMFSAAARARDAHMSGDAATTMSLTQGIAAMNMINSDEFGWDADRKAEIQEEINSILAGTSAPINRAEASLDTIAGPEDGAVPVDLETEPTPDLSQPEGMKQFLKDRFGAVYSGLTQLGHFQFGNAGREIRYAFTGAYEKSGEKKLNRRALLLMGAGVVALTAAFAAYKGVEASGIKIKVPGVPDVPRGGGGNNLQDIERVLSAPGHSEQITRGMKTGATYIQAHMLESRGIKLTPSEQLDIYHRLVNKYGSEGYAKQLMYGSVESVPAPVDKYGTMTIIHPGEAGFTNRGVQAILDEVKSAGYGQ